MNFNLHQINASKVGRWNSCFERWPVVFNVPKGLEGACAGIGRREGFLRLKTLCPGFLRAQRTEATRLAQAMWKAPIWSFGSFILTATVDASAVSSGNALADAEDAVNAASQHFNLVNETYWLNCPKNETAEAKLLAAQLLRSNALMIRNAPSDYHLTLRLTSFGDKIFLLLGPSISVKKRFAYRHEDVGASINPVLAAAMVRLAPPVEGGVVIDPTCGSGTLLAERLAFSNEAGALGIDLSARARRAFTTNLLDGPAARHFRFNLGNAVDSANWEPCKTVVANLPFGIRVKQEHQELETLYNGVLRNSTQFLEAGGRVIITSSFKRLLDQAFERNEDHFRILSRYRAEMGGLVYQIVVAIKS